MTKINIFVYVQEMYTFIGPPFSAIFLAGMLWKKINGKDAFISVLAGLGLSILIKYLVFGPLADVDNSFANFIKPFANQGLIVWGFTTLLIFILGAITPAAKAENVAEGLIFNFRNMKLGGGMGDKWYNSVLLWWSICFAIMILFVIIFGVIL
jgi:SSS family solute:Na+ symporter